MENRNRESGPRLSSSLSSSFRFRVSGAALFAAIAIFALAPCGLFGQGADAVSAATGETESWSIALAGTRADSLVASYYEKLFNAGAVKRQVEKKGVKYEYRGLPLWKIVAMVDGPDSVPPYAFDEAKWKAGYDITLVAKDGYAATFSTKDIAPDALILACEENGKWGSPQTVGDSPKNLWVRDIASIETSLAPASAATGAEAFSIDLDINGTKVSYSLDELRSSDLYMEAPGSYTTSAGTKYTNVYGGVKLRTLVERFAKLSDKDSLSFVAMDGYEMTYPGSLVMDESDGTWLLAFTMDGEALPKDPGYVRTIKVGAGKPNIDGHLSVRMVRKIVVRQKDFKDFKIALSGKMSQEMDRSTIQSCVSCHGKTVTFERKGIVATYTGFPAWLLLGYVDDPKNAPHRQDKSIPAYESLLARAGYLVDFVASDGFAVTVNAKDMDRNDDLIVAMYKNGEILGVDEFPLALVWDRNAALVPAGIKNVKMLKAVKARF
jgi:hypothetical protein